MTALVISDDDEVIPAVPVVKADLLISCGDLMEHTILDCAAKTSCRQVLAVKGNHDTTAPFSDPIIDLHLKTREIFGVRFGGFCGRWRYKPRGNFLFEQAEVERALKDFPPVAAAAGRSANPQTRRLR